MKFMHILPETRRDWVAVSLFPFRAYTIIAPLMSGFFFRWLDSPAHYRHFYSPTFADDYPMLLMFPCGAILVCASFGFAVVGFKANARSCAGFGIAALVLGYWLLPPLAHT